MKRYYPVSCQACGLSLRVPERIVPPLWCSCGVIVELPEGVELVTVEEFSREHAAQSVNAQREHWLRLHRFPFSDDWGCGSRCDWWAKWQADIPNLGCDCRKHWKELVEQHPPKFSSRGAFFAWTVEAHNRVNERLGKPVVTLEEALRLHAASSRVE